MNSSIKLAGGAFGIFGLGVALGCFIMHRHNISRLEKLVDQASAELREMYERKYNKDKTEKTGIEEPIAKAEVEAKVAYSSYVTSEEGAPNTPVEPKNKSDMEAIRVIAPTEIGLEESYDIVTIELYSNGVAIDDLGNPVELLEDHIGDALNFVGEYSPNSVYVVNDDENIYYEILTIDEAYIE